MVDAKDTPAGPSIAVENLECGYDGKIVLKNVSFTVKRGEIFFIIGGSGCGKSTLLRHMVGLHTPTGGTVKFFGQPFHEADTTTRRAMLRRFGMLFQSG